MADYDKTELRSDFEKHSELLEAVIAINGKRHADIIKSITQRPVHFIRRECDNSHKLKKYMPDPLDTTLSNE